jgi:chitin synthase
MWEAGSVASGKTGSSYVTASSVRSRKQGTEYSYAAGARPSQFTERPSQPSQYSERPSATQRSIPVLEQSYGENDSMPSGSYAASTTKSIPGPFAASGKQPTNEQLLQETKRILATADLMTLTKKQIRDELSALFGVDLKPRKEALNQMIDSVLQGQL